MVLEEMKQNLTHAHMYSGIEDVLQDITSEIKPLAYLRSEWIVVYTPSYYIEGTLTYGLYE